MKRKTKYWRQYLINLPLPVFFPVVLEREKEQEGRSCHWSGRQEQWSLYCLAKPLYWFSLRKISSARLGLGSLLVVSLRRWSVGNIVIIQVIWRGKKGRRQEISNFVLRNALTISWRYTFPFLDLLLPGKQSSALPAQQFHLRVFLLKHLFFPECYTMTTYSSFLVNKFNSFKIH